MVFRAGIEVLIAATKDGTFTPVIGAACSSLDDEGEPRHELAGKIRLKARKIAERLEPVDHRYLDELIDLDIPTKGEIAIPEPLLNFYVALVSLDHCAALTFKTGVAEHTNEGKACEFLWKRYKGISLPRQLPDWHVPLAKSDHREQLQKALKNAIEASSALRHAAEKMSWTNAGLGPDGIHENLVTLQSSLFGTPGQPVEDGSLNLTDLLWTGNLLWHCLRFDLPYYPTSSELAFQLSLYTTGGDDTPRAPQPMLSQAAEATTEPLDLLTKWFRIYSASSGQSQFYEALAKWLQWSYDHYKASSERPLPLAFTTNYDQEIEKALETLQCAYHVVFPAEFESRRVAAKRPRYEGAPESTEQTVWLMKTVDNSTGMMQLNPWQYAGKTTDTHRSSRNEVDPYEPDRLMGPVIVKLHGSPLDQLPVPAYTVNCLPRELMTLARSDKQSSAFHHRIVLTESDYLEDLRGDLPRWLVQRLQTEQRNLFFLGQAIGDWNIRRRLADHVKWISSEMDTSKRLFRRYVPGSGRQTPPFHRFAVNRITRYFDAAFMGPLGIAQIKADLTKVRSLLDNQVRS